MFLIGLTGGIAAGKSTVAKHWVALGGIEIDADVIAREVVAVGTPGAKQIEEAFGSDYFDAEGNLDRKKLGSLVFTDDSKRIVLEGIVHPLVRARSKELINQQADSAMVIYTVPLLVEAAVDLPFDVVVSVEAPEAERIKRLTKSRGMTEAEAIARMSAQATPLERAASADYILSSNQSLAGLLHDCENLWNKLEVMSQGK